MDKNKLAEEYALERIGNVENILDLEHAWLSGFEACESILKKYINHVSNEEGTDFIEYYHAFGGCPLNEEELEYLEKIRKNLED